MTRTRNRGRGEVFSVVLVLALGGLLLYTLLPFITTPNQVVVPPSKEMATTQLLLTLLVAATALGAPVTLGLVLALVFRFLSKRLPASSSAAPEFPSVKPRRAALAAAQPAAVPHSEALAWKIVAALMVLAVSAAGLVWLGLGFAQMYGLN
jgi:hypothetical protein